METKNPTTESKTGKAREFVPSTDLIYRAVLKQIEKLLPASNRLRHLDIGAGSGLLLKQVRDRFQVEQVACDYSATLRRRLARTLSPPPGRVPNTPKIL
jgi:hypothetical protein